jgi:hypothetical protein
MSCAADRRSPKPLKIENAKLTAGRHATPIGALPSQAGLRGIAPPPLERSNFFWRRSPTSALAARMLSCCRRAANVVSKRGGALQTHEELW